MPFCGFNLPEAPQLPFALERSPIMNDREIRESEALTRVREFGADNAADFPATSLGGQKFAEINGLADELDTHGSDQSLGHGAAKTSTGAKKAARELLRQLMRAISETAKGMESVYPGISKTFRLPTSNGDEALLNAARAFVAAATPLKAEFISREMPATFLDDLSATIDQFESIRDSQNQNVGKRVSATASIKQILERGMTLKRELDPIVREQVSQRSSQTCRVGKRQPRRESATQEKECSDTNADDVRA